MLLLSRTLTKCHGGLHYHQVLVFHNSQRVRLFVYLWTFDEPDHGLLSSTTEQVLSVQISVTDSFQISFSLYS